MTTDTNTGFITVAPDVTAVYGNGWRQLWKNFLELLLVLIITWAVSAPFVIYSAIDSTPGFGYVFFNLAYNIFVLLPLGYGAYYVSLRAARGETVEIRGLFEGFKNYWNAILAGILTGVIIAVGFILLIVPGIIFACKLAFVPYLIVDRKMEVIAAVKTSWDWTNGHAGEIFLMGLLAIPISIAGFICLGVGIIPAAMWIQVAFGSMYHAVSSQKEAPVANPSPIVP